jgi:polar amino acid transport system substrate-binding protein
MMIKKIFFILFLYSGLFLYGSEKIVVITTLYDYPPFVFKKDGIKAIHTEVIPPSLDAKSLQGYSWDVVRESFHSIGYTIKLKIVPWARGMKYVKNGRADLIFPAGKNQQREKEFFYSKEYTDRQNYVIYAEKDSNIKWNGLESLEGLRVGTVYEWSYGDDFDKADYFKKESVIKVSNGLKKLIKGSIDCVVGYEINYDYEIKKMGIGKKIKKFPSFAHSDEFLIGSKKYPHTKKLLEEFDRGKKMIIKNGVFDKINKKWLVQ